MKPDILIQTNSKLVISGLYFAIINSALIIMAKFYGWSHTNSQAILGSLVDSLLDMVSSGFNILALRISLQPPDNNHRFGHEKFQDLAIFAQVIFFLMTGSYILFSSIKALFLPNNGFPESEYALNAMYFCAATTWILVLYQTYIYHKTKSSFMAADKLHYLTDLLTDFAVIISIKLSTKYWFIDPISGILIAIYILYATYKLLRKVLKNLVDEEFSDDQRKKILEIIQEFPLIKGVHDLKTRHAASKPFIQFHIELDGNLTLYESHRITEALTDKLLKIFPGGEVIIHQDPIGIDEIVQYREQINL